MYECPRCGQARLMWAGLVPRCQCGAICSWVDPPPKPAGKPKVRRRQRRYSRRGR